MKYDIIPEYSILFENDQFMLEEEPGLFEIAYALSYFGYLYVDKETMNKTFFEESVGVICIDKEKIQSYLNNKLVITELGILLAWKKSFMNLQNHEKKYYYQDLRFSFNYLYREIISEQEKSVNRFEKENKENSIMTYSLLNRIDNKSFQFFRMYYMLIVKDKDILKNENMKNQFNKMLEKFERLYGIDLINYIRGLYIIIDCNMTTNFNLLKREKCLSKSNFVFSVSALNSVKSKNIVNKVVDLLSFNYDDAKTWCIENTDNILDFSLFQDKPLYQISGDNYVPVTIKFMENQYFTGLLYKIRKAYDQEDKVFWSLIGKLFEDYIVYIFKTTFDALQDEYIVIPEFKYGNKHNSKMSPDIVVINNSNVFVFEVKSARPLNSVYSYENNKALEESIDKVIKNPINQSIDRITEIINLQVNEYITCDKNYYFIAATMDNFPDHYSDFSELKEKIRKCKFQIKGTFNFSIEEVELLCGAMLNQFYPLAKFLDEYKNMPEHYSFKNYINRYTRGAEKSFFKEIQNQVNDFIEKIEL